MLELLEIHQAPHPIVKHDLAVLLHDFLTGRLLRGREEVLDHLEDEWKRGQGEDRHDQPWLARGDDETALAMASMSFIRSR